MTGVKICGLTRPTDTEAAVAAGAEFTGVIFAGGPRNLTPAQALDVLAPTRGRARAVGVFGAAPAHEIAAVASALALDVVQLHADPTPADVDAVRRGFPGLVWAASRVRGEALSPRLPGLFAAADAVVLDAHHPGALGGTGTRLDWDRLAGPIAPLRNGRGGLVLAGGLRPENVAHAVAALAPDVADVSSGVEGLPGEKDHAAIRAFVAAVRTASPRAGDRG